LMPLRRPPLFPYTTLFRSRCLSFHPVRSVVWQSPTRSVLFRCPHRDSRANLSATKFPDSPPVENSHLRILCPLVKKNSPVSLLRSEEHTSELQSRFDLVCR